MNKELKEVGKQLKEILDKYPSKQKEILFYIFGEDTIRNIIGKPTYEELQQKVNQLEEKEELHLNRIDELTDRVVKLETNRDEAIKYIKENNLWSSNKTQNGYSYMKNECRELLSILERGINGDDSSFDNPILGVPTFLDKTQELEGGSNE